jgi:hypothetical protein
MIKHELLSIFTGSDTFQKRQSFFFQICFKEAYSSSQCQPYSIISIEVQKSEEY